MTPSTDPTPYITAAYAIGALCTFGYSLWLYLDRKRVERHLKVLEQESKR